MKAASAISTALHAAVLLWAVVSFSGKAFEVTPAESLPVDLVTADQFSKMMKGAKDAPKKEEPAPLVEKKAEPTPAEIPTPKVTEKKEIPTPAAAPGVMSKRDDSSGSRKLRFVDVTPNGDFWKAPVLRSRKPREQLSLPWLWHQMQ